MGGKGTERVKILYARKPAGDAKTVGEVLGEEGLAKGDGEVEMGVMVMGGVEGEKGDGEMVGGEAATGEGGGVAQGVRGEEVMGSAEFWEDLRGWLMQRVRDEGMAGEAWSLFKRGWDGR